MERACAATRHFRTYAQPVRPAGRGACMNTCLCMTIVVRSLAAQVARSETIRENKHAGDTISSTGPLVFYRTQYRTTGFNAFWLPGAA
eukprot:2543931-Alexandrium_andersonii.AAC.1